ncbi:hypothetical protein RND71_009238 [Anisodus tanguticus]|uniref:Uncharacterized protein n=1 Tax=Anisodus tanguticus TaxID=243964 RepID=A0AAE1SF36_9SOLA|nr:hypothetical protein RND71_009238 [Anisodus tanguticus]
MNLQQTTYILSRIPILGCIMHTLFKFLCHESFINEIHENETQLTDREIDEDAANASNVAAQKHFQQVQHIKGA